jgi:ABC-type lipoprotein release transport system permease subunit
MFGAFERLVALRYLAARKGERFVSFNAWFSLIGIALGVATLIIVMSVMNGFRQELLGRILGLNGHLGAYAAEGGPLRDFDAVAARIRAVPGIVEATPIIEGQVLITSEAGGASGGLARGIRPADLRERDIIARNILRGSLADFEGEDTIVVGTGLASRLRVGVGDRITLVSPQGRATVVGTLPRLRAFRVVALFNVGMNEYDSTFAFMPLEAAQAYFQMPGAATQIEVFVEEPTRVRAATREIQRVLADRPVRILDWQESNNSFFAAVQVERNVMFLILTLIILVGRLQHRHHANHAGEGQAARHRHPPHDGRPARRGAARVPHVRRRHRRARHHRRLAARPRVLRLHRGDPPVPPMAHLHPALPGRGLLPRAAPGGGGCVGGDAGDRHELRPVSARRHVPGVARGPARPGGSAPQ